MVYSKYAYLNGGFAMKKLNVAVIGQGRSGRDIHGVYFKSEKNTQFNVAYVVDRDEKRRERALGEYPSCEVFASYTELFGRADKGTLLYPYLSRDSLWHSPK